MTPTHFQTLLLVCLGLVGSLVSGASILRHDEFQIKAINEALDPSGNYLLSWEVDLTEKKITFEAEVATLGFVGLGISPSGSMAGADIFIAGVYENGTTYGFDMHAEGMMAPILDNQQDWTLIEVTENIEASKTYVKVSRLLNTCDDEDYPISNDTTRIIWSIGSNDDIGYHGGNRGTKSLNLLMPEDEDFNPEDYMNWDLESEIVMPTQDTTYWCTVKKAPVLDKTHHIIGFEPVLPDELAVNYTHHFVVYKCTAPEGMDADELFGKYLDHEGADCYLPQDDQPIKVLDYCMGDMIYVWTKGGKRTVFPAGVGYPFPEKIGENNYYLFEVHYDNPEVRDGLRFKTGGRVWYTDKGVQDEANLMKVAIDTGISITIPPSQNEYVVSGHCASECTAAGLSATGDEGVKVFNSLLHSHLSGRKMKVRHFREGVELPWIDFDNHYDFNFQQNKPLRDFVQILPGDQMTIECTYDTRWNNNKVVTGGLSTKEEMCQAFLWYYPKQEFEACVSVYPVEAHFEELGVTNYTVSDPSEGGMPRYTIVEPAELAGDYVETLNTKFQWNDEFIREYERKRRYNVHETSCLARYGGPTINVQFPVDAIEYIPEDVCESEGEPTR
ncbi:unnamed protein product [Orchesella dallaii]|uniref:DOMON domain-containing protein n=1 Tax=Orchesella dallaii TaxID=48710 RepID=A0ABP1QSE6_9HEXA